MSQYVNYTDTSESYDTTRIPFGVDRIINCLEKTAVPLAEQAVLDAGCGTGNYLQALRPHVGQLAGVDFSEGMLAQAREKVGDDVELRCGSITELPYDDASFHGITCNQVIHHLDQGPTKEDNPAEWTPHQFPNVTQFVREAYRVLQPGGALVINVSAHAQLTDGFWWADLIPTAVARLACRLPDISQLEPILADAGFTIESVLADLEGVLQGPAYLDPEGPLQEAWRAGDSTWNLTTESELDSALRRVEQMNASGVMQAYLDQRESARRMHGQSTFVCARK